MQSTRVFAYGEDTHTLRLTNKLVDLRAGYVNRIFSHFVWKSPLQIVVIPPKKEKRHPEWDTLQSTRVFAYGEDIRTLRLTNKLVDLRAGYVNRIFSHFVWKSPLQIVVIPPKKEKRHPEWDTVFFGGSTRI